MWQCSCSCVRRACVGRGAATKSAHTSQMLSAGSEYNNSELQSSPSPSHRRVGSTRQQQAKAATTHQSGWTARLAAGWHAPMRRRTFRLCDTNKVLCTHTTQVHLCLPPRFANLEIGLFTSAHPSRSYILMSSRCPLLLSPLILNHDSYCHISSSP